MLTSHDTLTDLAESVITLNSLYIEAFQNEVPTHITDEIREAQDGVENALTIMVKHSPGFTAEPRLLRALSIIADRNAHDRQEW